MTDKKNRQKARETVFRLFRYRPRSEKEVVEKLKAKAFPEDVIRETVDYFKKLEMLDDRLFARGWIQGRLNKPLGMRRIALELRKKGIHKDIIEEESEKITDYDETAAVRDLARRRLTRYKNVEKFKARQRLYAYLSRRGFSSGAVSKVLRELQ